MTLTRTITLCLALLCSAVSFAQSNFQKINLPIESFSGIALNIDAEVFLTQSDEFEVSVEGPIDLLNALNTNVRGNLWNIEYLNGVTSTHELTIQVSLPSLDFLANSSAGEIRGVGEFTDLVDLDLKIMGSGDIFLDVDVIDLNLKISGSGDIGLKGKAANQKVNIMGSGDVLAQGLESEICDVTITGNGNCKVSVQKTLDITLVGNGDIFFKGAPEIYSHIVGNGDING